MMFLPQRSTAAVDVIAIRFYAELNSYLPPALEAKTWSLPLREGLSVQGVLDALAVPPEKVDLVLVNGVSVPLDTVLRPHDRVSVYPVFESFDIRSVTRIRATPLRLTRFVLDSHLGKLAAHLRMLGFDTVYHTDIRDEDLIAISTQEQRILLSRDRLLLENPALDRCYAVRSTHPREQIVEVLLRFDLVSSVTPFTRCMICNKGLRSVDKAAIAHLLPPMVKETYTDFVYCEHCDRAYWNGSHYARMKEFIAEILEETRQRRESWTQAG